MLTGPNLWPAEQPVFRKTLELYFDKIRELSIVIFRLIAESLDLNFAEAFGQFCTNEVSAVRLLHYPPQELDGKEEQLGTGV